MIIGLLPRSGVQYADDDGLVQTYNCGYNMRSGGGQWLSKIPELELQDRGSQLIYHKRSNLAG